MKAHDCRVYGDLVMDALKSSGLLNHATVVLIGSAARGTQTWRSDVDLLVIFDGEARLRLRPPSQLHLHQESRSRFLERLRSGDDYPVWALRFGVCLHDPSGWWATLAAEEERHPHWPNWRHKIGLASKRLAMATSLLDMGDVDAAAEELLYAASQIARALLLRRGTFPLSRPELPAQVEPCDPEFASVLKRLLVAEPQPDQLHVTAAVVADRLTTMAAASAAS